MYRCHYTGSQHPVRRCPPPHSTSPARRLPRGAAWHQPHEVMPTNIYRHLQIIYRYLQISTDIYSAVCVQPESFRRHQPHEVKPTNVYKDLRISTNIYKYPWSSVKMHRGASRVAESGAEALGLPHPRGGPVAFGCRRSSGQCNRHYAV